MYENIHISDLPMMTIFQWASSRETIETRDYLIRCSEGDDFGIRILASFSNGGDFQVRIQQNFRPDPDPEHWLLKQLFSPDGELEVTRRDPLHLQILGGVPSQLQHLHIQHVVSYQSKHIS